MVDSQRKNRNNLIQFLFKGFDLIQTSFRRNHGHVVKFTKKTNSIKGIVLEHLGLKALKLKVS